MIAEGKNQAEESMNKYKAPEFVPQENTNQWLGTVTSAIRKNNFARIVTQRNATLARTWKNCFSTQAS
jgi:hypothetical protein